MKVTWWTDDGTERKGWVSLAPEASPETAAALAQMMRLAEASAEAAGPGGSEGREYDLKNA